MQTLYKVEGAQFRIEILETPKIQKFINAHSAMLDSSFQQVEMSETMRRRLERSNYIFSGMKTFHELNEAFPSLLDENGNRKPFEQFLNDVQKIDSTYNQNYLRAEYNFVQASAQMAAKWERFVQDGDRYNLQYRTAGDNKVRPEHAALNRVTLPITDSFWEEFYPPNGWNCRCTVMQVRKSKYPVTPHDEAMALGEEATGKDTKGIFRFNAGLEQKSVPDYNPYTIRRCNDCDLAKGKTSLVFIPDNELCAACKLVRYIKEKEIEKIDKNRKKYEELKQNPEYEKVFFNPKNGGLKATHINHNFDPHKGWYETLAQETGYKYGHSVILTEERHDIYKKRNCEGLWDGLRFEIAAAETVETSNIRNALKHCASKPGSQVAILLFPEKAFNLHIFNEGYFRFYGLRHTSQYKKFDMIYCITKDGDIIYKKKPSD